MKAKTLKLNKEFKRLYYRGKSSVKPCIVVYVMKNRLGCNRIGLTCGKALGNAVKRNRAKRLMYESYRLSEKKIKKGYDFVLVARSRMLNKDFKTVEKELLAALSDLELIERDEKNTDTSC